MKAAYAEFETQRLKNSKKEYLMLTMQQVFQSISEDEKVSGVCTYPLVFQSISSLRLINISYIKEGQYGP